MADSDTTTPRALGDTDAPHMSPVTPAEDVRTIMLNRIAWGAVLAGVVAALVTQLVLNLLGIGIGAATLNPGTPDNPAASTFSIGAGIWFLCRASSPRLPAATSPGASRVGRRRRLRDGTG